MVTGQKIREKGNFTRFHSDVLPDGPEDLRRSTDEKICPFILHSIDPTRTFVSPLKRPRRSLLAKSYADSSFQLTRCRFKFLVPISQRYHMVSLRERFHLAPQQSEQLRTELRSRAEPTVQQIYPEQTTTFSVSRVSPVRPYRCELQSKLVMHILPQKKVICTA